MGAGYGKFKELEVGTGNVTGNATTASSSAARLLEAGASTSEGDVELFDYSTFMLSVVFTVLQIASAYYSLRTEANKYEVSIWAFLQHSVGWKYLGEAALVDIPIIEINAGMTEVDLEGQEKTVLVWIPWK